MTLLEGWRLVWFFVFVFLIVRALGQPWINRGSR